MHPKIFLSQLCDKMQPDMGLHLLRSLFTTACCHHHAGGDFSEPHFPVTPTTTNPSQPTPKLCRCVSPDMFNLDPIFVIRSSCDATHNNYLVVTCSRRQLQFPVMPLSPHQSSAGVCVSGHCLPVLPCHPLPPRSSGWAAVAGTVHCSWASRQDPPPDQPWVLLLLGKLWD